MCFWKKKKQTKTDYSHIAFLLIDTDNCVKLNQAISDTIKSTNKYYYELFTDDNKSDVKFYIDCKFLGVNLIPLKDTIKSDYQGLIKESEVDENKYGLEFASLLNYAWSWQKEIVKADDGSYYLNNIIHFLNPDDTVNMYMTFKDGSVYADFEEMILEELKKNAQIKAV